MVILKINYACFYCQHDEEAFFQWLSLIKSCLSFTREGDSLYLSFTSLLLPESDLRALMALFIRYKFDMKLLAQFLNEKNKDWFFHDRESQRNSKIFGKKPRKKEFTQRMVQANWKRWYRSLAVEN